MKLCACGKPLHYTDRQIQRAVQWLVDQKGECVEVKVIGKPDTYLVPRHFIALHGMKASELEDLAAFYGFKQVRKAQ